MTSMFFLPSLVYMVSDTDLGDVSKGRVPVGPCLLSLHQGMEFNCF